MSDPFITVARLDEIRPGKSKRVIVEGHPILLANVDGELFALDDTCTHEDSSLSLGCLRDGRVKCTLHGSWFDLRSGEPSEPPATQPLRTYPVECVDDEVRIAYPAAAE